ncbi:calcium-binding protein [Chlamydiifrater volucris]|uniref:calcium-binding protein n=1 Tax=Chlamydiifrater volucris TaxID=2681470 RepID=UPI001BCDA62B|nr:calcium-binding protein [Chlamydiifrater volucris]
MEKQEQSLQEAMKHVQNIRKNLLSNTSCFFEDSEVVVSPKNSRDSLYLFPCGELAASIKHSMESIGSYINKFSNKQQLTRNPFIHEVEDLLEVFDGQSDLLESIGVSEEYNDLRNTYEHVIGTEAKDSLAIKEQEVNLDNDLSKVPTLDSLVEVKRDRYYELFFIRNEDNKRFYTESLAQIIAKHGKLHEASSTVDPLTKTFLWQGNEKERQSNYIFSASEPFIRDFYKLGALKNKTIPEVSAVHNAILALMLSKTSKTKISSKPIKSNLAYFNDFLGFLREATLLLEEGSFNTSEKTDLRITSGRIVDKWILSLFFYRPDNSEALRYLFSQMNSSMEGKKMSASKYVSDLYDEQHRIFSKFPNGPLLKSLDYLSDKHSCQQFDPFKMGMTPSFEGNLVCSNGKAFMKVFSSANPITQESVLYASLNQEFLSLLKILKREGSSVFVVNFQNRQSKKDKARTRLLEECADNSDFSGNIKVFSCPEPEDLLLNIEGKEEIKDFNEFVQAVLEELTKNEVSSSYRMDSLIKNRLEKEFLPKCLNSLKDVFFSKKKILFRNDKLLLLHLVSYLLVFKQLEIILPNYFWIMSKDGLDYVGAFLAGLCCFSRKSTEWDEKFLKSMLAKLSVSTFLMRDRQVMSPCVELLEKLMSSLRKNRKNLPKLHSLYELDLEGWEFMGFVPQINEG